MQCWRQPAYVLPSEDSGGILVCKRLDHMIILTLPVIIDKRERFMTKARDQNGFIAVAPAFSGFD